MLNLLAPNPKKVTADHLDMRVGIGVFASNVRVVPPRRSSLSRAWL